MTMCVDPRLCDGERGRGGGGSGSSSFDGGGGSSVGSLCGSAPVAHVSPAARAALFEDHFARLCSVHRVGLATPSLALRWRVSAEWIAQQEQLEANALRRSPQDLLEPASPTMSTTLPVLY